MRPAFFVPALMAGVLSAAIVVLPFGSVAKAGQKPDAPAQQKESPKAKPGMLQPGTEERLKWGEPVGGLRAAVAFRPRPDGPKAAGPPDLYLAVQNVSDAPIRLRDVAEAPKLRELVLKIDGRTQMIIVAKEATGADVVLQPREAVFLLQFPVDAKNPDGRTAGSLIAEGVLKESNQTLVAKLRIEDAPAGAWMGLLVTGDSKGSAASSALGEGGEAGRDR